MVKMAEKRVSCGRDLFCCPDLNSCLEESCKLGYDFICAPIVNPRYKREFIEGPALKRPGALTRSDTLLSSQDWNTLVVAKVSPWLQLDSKQDHVLKNSEKAFKQELTFASHLRVPAIMVPLKGPDTANIARMLNQHILQGHNHQYWIQVPMKAPQDQCDDIFRDKMVAKNSPDTWKWWKSFHSMCDTSKNLGLALELTSDLPPSDELDRWCGEPIKAAILPTNIFLTNKKGFPVLTKAHQTFVQKLYKLNVQMIVSGSNHHPERGLKTYQQYLENLWQNRDNSEELPQFVNGFEDYLESPMQPLKDNLESQTYEGFEKDPVKYSQYQKAVHHALLHRVPDKEKDTKTSIVMVLGAGRGPLVTASIKAAKKADRKIQVYAVEKNPNAVITLENKRYEMWGDLVTVVSSDMRVWEAPEKADIIVSELLGAFGDNELSPECLDGAQKFLKDDGISIPTSYTSYLTPLSSCKLWNETRLCKDSSRPPEAVFEMPYAVRLHNTSLQCTPKPLFTFSHPNKGILDNSRYDILEFTINQDTVLHGFGGYFDMLLYGDVYLSTVPHSPHPGTFSWLNIYFPIKYPLYLKKGEKLVVHFWRECTDKNVWYEWCITEPSVHAIHNPKGRSNTIGL